MILSPQVFAIRRVLTTQQGGLSPTREETENALLREALAAGGR